MQALEAAAKACERGDCQPQDVAVAAVLVGGIDRLLLAFSQAGHRALQRQGDPRGGRLALPSRQLGRR